MEHPCARVVALVAATGHRRFLELTDPAHPDYSAHYRAALCGDVDAPTPVPPIALPTAPPAPAPAKGPPLIPLAENLAIERRIRECPWRGPRVRCGCNELRHCNAACGPPADPWVVDRPTCRACQSGDPDRPGRFGM